MNVGVRGPTDLGCYRPWLGELGALFEVHRARDMTERISSLLALKKEWVSEHSDPMPQWESRTHHPQEPVGVWLMLYSLHGAARAYCGRLVYHGKGGAQNGRELKPTWTWGLPFSGTTI